MSVNRTGRGAIAVNKGLGCVVVTFNPDCNLIKLVNSLYKEYEKMVIVDNASTINNNFIEIFKDKDDIKIICNEDNLGIATALNVGVNELGLEGIKYAMLLDQDSSIDGESIKILYNTIKNNKNYGIVGPVIGLKKDADTLIGGFIAAKGKSLSKKHIMEHTKMNVLTNITSGSIINISLFDSVGKFWEGLFIEGVDDEYCLRMHSCGYQVIVVADAILAQNYGEKFISLKKFGVVWNATFHKPYRNYYVFRNGTLIVKRYMFTQPKYVVFKILSMFKRLLTIYLVEDEVWEKYKYSFKGIFDGIIGREGKIYK